jgi:PAS domain S-box-containing protein
MPITWRGKPYSIGIDRDITERKRAEQALREREQKYRNIFENVQDVYYEASIDGTILEVSPSIEIMSKGQYQRNDLIGKSLYDFYSGAGERQALLSVLKERGSVADFEVTLKNRDGSFIPCSISSKIQFDAQGSPKTIIGSMRDITERKKAEETQLENVRRFHGLFDEAPVGYHECDSDGRIVEVNRTELELLGYMAEEMLSHHAWEFIVENETSRKAIAAKIVGSLQSHLPYERTFRRKNGTEICVLLSDRTLHNETGKVVGIRSALQDITERKRTESELRLMAQTVASAQDCISITDLENRFLFANEAFQHTHGFTTEELLGKDISVVRSPDTPTTTDKGLLDTLSGGWHGELLHHRKDGNDFPVELWKSLVKDDAGTPVAMVGVARDITERKKAEQHLMQSEEQFRLIAENVADMIAVLDLDGKRIYNSPSYSGILGDPESLKGTDGYQEIHPEDRDRVREVFRETIRTGVGQRIEYRLMGKEGSERTIDSKGSVIRDGEGKIFRVVVVSRDVTEEKMRAAQFLRSQRMESIGTLAGGIAHDLNNVLAPIMMAIEVLRSKVSDQAGQRILSTIETSAKRGADIVRQVLAFGRGVKGERILVQLKHVIYEVAKIAGETFPKSIEMRMDMPRDLWTVLADPTQMHQVLLNMLVNARDAMPKGGSLTISAENVKLDENYSRMHLEAKPGVYVCMVITDTGTGIPSDIREKIFDPFFTTKEIGVGTGLGLSTTLAIVKSHQGFINLYSEEGKGTTFRIYIPATGTASNKAAASEEADLPVGNGELILVIDDEAAIRVITKETLQAHGYKAITASDGAEGVALFAENKKDIKVAITDIMMPVMDGTAAIIALKRINPGVKIIAASGLTTRGNITSASDPNVQAFLTKPYTAEKLLKTLAETLR